MVNVYRPDSQVKHITELIVDMVARDLWPAAKIEAESFQALMKNAEPG